MSTWTKFILDESLKHDELQIFHVDTAVRWRAIWNNSPIIRLFGGSIQAVWNIALAWFKIIRRSPHVIHICSTAGPGSIRDIVILWLGRRMHIPGIIHYRTGRLLVDKEENGFDWHLACNAIKLAETVVVLTKSTMQCIEGISPKNNIIILPNPINLAEIEKIIKYKNRTAFSLKQTSKIAFLGQIVPTKGIGELVKACTQIQDAELLLVGPVDNRYKKELEEISKAKENGCWLFFLGEVQREEALRQLIYADIFALPSYREGFPNSIIEAMSLSKPIVASYVGAISEILDIGGRGQCGQCVEPKDIKGLQAALSKILNDNKLRKKYGARARKRVEKLYSSEKVFPRLLNIWHKLIY